MKWTEITSGQTNGAFQRLMAAFGEKADVAVTRINTEPTFVERLAEYAINGSTVPNASQDGAREIMGKNFFGIPEAIKHFGINPTKRELAILSEIPFSSKELMMRKDTHILVAVFPISIIEISKKVQKDLFNIYALWNENPSFIKDRGITSWQLILKTPVINSVNKNWIEQQFFINSDEEVPTAQIMVYTIIGHFLNTKEKLFEEIYFRVSNLDPDGDRVFVSVFCDMDLNNFNLFDKIRNRYIGLSVAMK